MKRQSGILMHISSLPSDYGIGKLGESARAFVNFLVESGTKVWQILPLSPTSYGDSPYQSFSVFAGNPFFIDFDRLISQGYLNHEDFKDIDWGEDPRRVDYAKIYKNTFIVLRCAFERFDCNDESFQQFCQRNEFWLPDYALFMALKDANDGKPWFSWDRTLAQHDEAALEKAKTKYQQDIAFYSVLQYWFYEQWAELKIYSNQRGISILGDIPIYVAYDSVEVWAHPELFQLDKRRKPTCVAGCPPDDFAPDGQLWGNPLYNWEYHQKTNFAWWIQRLRYTALLYDTIRIDHFRGFESYYAIPYGKPTAAIGQWRKGPGAALFHAVKSELGNISIIAEDLGFITPQVRQMLQECGYPGMKIIQFAFDGDPKNEHLPQNFETTNCVAYTGTHDNTTLHGWVRENDVKSLTFAKQYLQCRTASDLVKSMLRETWSSIAYLAVAQMQDFLDIGKNDRMNTPSTLGGNWQFRTVISDFNPRVAKRIRQLNELYNRLNVADDVSKIQHRGTDAIPESRRSKTARTYQKGRSSKAKPAMRKRLHPSEPRIKKENHKS